MTSRKRDMGRTYLSGSQKKARKEELEERRKKDIGSSHRITDMFLKASTSCAPPSSSSIEDSASAPPAPTPSVLVSADSAPPASSTETSALSLLPTSSSSVDYSLSDPHSWPAVTDALRISFITANINQKLNVDFKKSARVYDDGTNRYLNSSMFLRTLANGETAKRTWLLYSETSGKVYCSACKLFSDKDILFSLGFNDWKNARRIGEHENTDTHRKFVMDCISLGRKYGRIDSHMEIQFEKERGYWRNVLLRVVAVVQFLAQRGLAFRGENEIFGSCNNGNFLGIIELLVQFDPFIAQHVSRYGDVGRGNVSYLSSTICNEFIQLMAKKVLFRIISDVKIAKYFAISVDSTPDITHVDQLTFIVRFVDSSGKPVERFLKFITISGHDGETLTNVILDTLLKHEIDIMNCRGQSYDNAANMSGKYIGVQARIKQVNPLAEYVPCSAHSLNLVEHVQLNVV